jgi:hypothetical protein
MRMRVEKRELAREFNLLSSPGQTRARVARELLEDERDHELSSSCELGFRHTCLRREQLCCEAFADEGIDFRHADSFQTSQQ